VFTVRYALSPYIKQIRFVFKGLTNKFTKSPILFHACVNLQHWLLFREFNWFMHFSCYSEWWSGCAVESVSLFCLRVTVCYSAVLGIFNYFLSWRGLVKRKVFGLKPLDVTQHCLYKQDFSFIIAYFLPLYLFLWLVCVPTKIVVFRRAGFGSWLHVSCQLCLLVQRMVCVLQPHGPVRPPSFNLPV
jgi:hypothetical protein